jgi:thiol-disulfide isomerase/thioredoxin
MRTSHRLLIAAVFGLVSLSACDVIEGPKVDPNGFTGSANKVLVEDFTGHMCGNCPRAHETAAALQETFGENVVVVAVHAGGFARVIPAIGYGADYNTEMGTELEAFYRADALTGLPIGLVNRRLWGSSALTPYADWSANVSTVLAEAPKMRLDVATTYTADDRTLTVNADLEYFTEGDADHQIVVLITEDSIISKQSDYSLAAQHVDDYVHMHVLRGVVTPGGTWGTPVKGNTIVLGETFDLTYSIVLDPAWVPEHCNVVVYVQDNATKEVLQVEEAHVGE